MAIIKTGNDRYEEYENLLLERDQAKKDAESIWIAYTREFGQLITDIYQEELECVKRKKIISYCQSMINRSCAVDQTAMNEWLRKELAAYYEHLKKLIKDNQACRDAKEVSAYELKRSKELYHRLVKQPKLMELWERTVAAYHASNVRELSELEVLTQKALRELGISEIKVDIPDIEERIKELKNEIHDITHAEPYIYKSILENDSTVKKHREELEATLDAYRRYRKELDSAIEDIMRDGGITITWQMS